LYGKCNSGIVRLILSLIFIIFSVISFIQLHEFQDYSSMSAGSKSGVFIVLFLILNFPTYMILNGIREINNKRIKFKFMYIVVAITEAIITLVFVRDFKNVSHILSVKLIALLVMLLLMAYFLIGDFINLFIRKNKTNQ